MRSHSRERIILAILAIAMAASTARLLSIFPFPFYIGLFFIGPFAYVWFAIPGLLVPFLVSRFPVNRRHLPKLAALTLFSFAVSFAYLHFNPSFEGNIGGETATWGLWFAAAVLTLLGAASYLHESRAMTFIYHLVFATWLFAVAFPYTGEFCC